MLENFYLGRYMIFIFLRGLCSCIDLWVIVYNSHDMIPQSQVNTLDECTRIVTVGAML